VARSYNNDARPSDLYSLEPSGSLFRQPLASLKSLSVCPMYATLLARIYFAKRFVI